MSERWMRIGRMLKLRYRYYLLFQSKLHIAKRRVRHPLKLGESKKKKKKRNIRKRVPTDPRRKDYRIEANRPKDSFNEERKKKKNYAFCIVLPFTLPRLFDVLEFCILRHPFLVEHREWNDEKARMTQAKETRFRTSSSFLSRLRFDRGELETIDELEI